MQNINAHTVTCSENRHTLITELFLLSANTRASQGNINADTSSDPLTNPRGRVGIHLQQPAVSSWSAAAPVRLMQELISQALKLSQTKQWDYVDVYYLWTVYETASGVCEGASPLVSTWPPASDIVYHPGLFFSTRGLKMLCYLQWGWGGS